MSDIYKELSAEDVEKIRALMQQQVGLTQKIVKGCLFTIILAPFFLMVFGMVIYSISQWLKYQSWEEVPAKILTVGKKYSSKGFEVTATYEYFYAGKLFKSSKLYFFPITSDLWKSANPIYQELDRHKKSQQLLPCYVNPKKTTEVFLYRFFPTGIVLLFLGGLAVVLLLYLIAKKLFFGFKNLLKASQAKSQKRKEASYLEGVSPGEVGTSPFIFSSSYLLDYGIYYTFALLLWFGFLELLRNIKAPFPLLCIFYFITVLLLYNWLNIWFYRGKLRVEEDALFFSGGLFGFGRSYTLHRSEIVDFRIEKEESHFRPAASKKGNEPAFIYIKIIVLTNQGKINTIARNLESPKQAKEWLVEIKKRLDFKEEDVVNVPENYQENFSLNKVVDSINLFLSNTAHLLITLSTFIYFLWLFIRMCYA